MKPCPYCGAPLNLFSVRVGATWIVLLMLRCPMCNRLYTVALQGQSWPTGEGPPGQLGSLIEWIGAQNVELSGTISPFVEAE